MEKNMRIRYGVAMGLLVAVGALGLFLSTRPKVASAPVGNIATTTLTSAPSTQTAQPIVGAPGTFKINIASAPNSAPTIPLPDLSRPYTPPSSVPQSVQESDQALVATAIQQLKIDPNREPYWLQLGGYRKNADDFIGAEQIYVYLATRWPSDPIAYNNLADLYGNYLHDYAKAVVNWNMLIKISPNNIGAYINLATLYRANMHDVGNAKATLERGLQANPSSPDLKQALSTLATQ